MEGNNTQTAASAPQPRVLSTSLSAAMQAGDSGETEKTASFDDIFAPPETESTPAEAAEAAEPGAPDEQPVKKEEPPPAQDILKQLAAEYGLNPADPKHKALLEKMAQEQSAGQHETEAGQAPEDDDEYERLEQLLFGATESPVAQYAPGAAQPQGQQGPSGPPPLPPGKFGDVLDDTNTVEEAMERWRDAWTPDPDTGEVDVKKPAAVWNAFFARQFMGMGMPAVARYVEAKLQHELGDAIKFFRQHQDRAHRQQLYSGVIERMGKSKGYENINGLFEQLSDKTFKIRQSMVDDTRMNRLLQADPWILDINKEDADPDKALQKTHLARLQALMRQWKKSDGAVALTDVKKLVESGQEIERKKQSEQSRQRLNAGTGATSAGAGQKSADDEWFENVLKAKGGRSMSVRDLLSSR